MSIFIKTPHTVLSLFIALVFICAATTETFARGGGHHSSGGSVSVSGYTRSNGTYVSGYNRSSSHYSGNSRSSGTSYGSSDYSSGGYSSGSHSSSYYGRSPINSHLGVSRHSSSASTHYTSGTYKSGYAKVERSETAKRQFLRQQGLIRIPSGYHIDHITPLSQGGSDTPSNMQLLSVEAHHQKTAAERRHY